MDVQIIDHDNVLASIKGRAHRLKAQYEASFESIKSLIGFTTPVNVIIDTAGSMLNAGTYEAVKKEVSFNLPGFWTCKEWNETFSHIKDFELFIFIHELQHHKQVEDGIFTFRLHTPGTCDGAKIWKGKEYPVLDLLRLNQFEYFKLPWETDANTVADAVYHKIPQFHKDVFQYKAAA